jgi:hypothetical protein
MGNDDVEIPLIQIPQSGIQVPRYEIQTISRSQPGYLHVQVCNSILFAGGEQNAHPLALCPQSPGLVANRSQCPGA